MKCGFVDVQDHVQAITNVEKMLHHEYETLGKWKDEGKLIHLFVKDDQTGAMLVFTGLELEEVKQRMESLPMSKYFEKVIYSSIDVQY